jgi:hypothetical protein
VHTGWPVEKLEQEYLGYRYAIGCIAKVQAAFTVSGVQHVDQLSKFAGSVLSTKRNGLDEYNFEAKKSDKHSNDVYLGLINYVNGTLVSDYNMFLQYAEQN